MRTDPRVIAVQYVLAKLRARLAAVRSDDAARGALSLEWVVIAFGLVVAAGLVGAFVKGYIDEQDTKIATP